MCKEEVTRVLEELLHVDCYVLEQCIAVMDESSSMHKEATKLLEEFYTDTRTPEDIAVDKAKQAAKQAEAIAAQMGSGFTWDTNRA